MLSTLWEILCHPRSHFCNRSQDQANSLERKKLFLHPDSLLVSQRVMETRGSGRRGFTEAEREQKRGKRRVRCSSKKLSEISEARAAADP